MPENKNVVFRHSHPSQIVRVPRENTPLVFCSEMCLMPLLTCIFINLDAITMTGNKTM